MRIRGTWRHALRTLPARQAGLLVTGLLLAGLALAQTSRPGPPAASGIVTGAVPDKAADSAGPQPGMERAQRQANNPLRMILEASRIRRKPGDAEGPETADAGRRPAGPAISPAAVPPAASPDRLATLRTLSADVALDGSSRPLVPSLRATEMPVPAPEGLSPVPAPMEMPDGAEAPPLLLDIVEPVLTEPEQAEAARLGVLRADLRLRPDGSVAEVSVLTEASRPLQRAVQAALLQWRFAPLPAERLHRVELVVRGAANR